MSFKSVTDGLAKQEALAPVSSKQAKKRIVSSPLSAVLLDQLDHAVAAADCKGRIVMANEAWRRLKRDFLWLGGEPDGPRKEPVFLKEAFHEIHQEAGTILSGFQNVLQGLAPEFRAEFQVLHSGKSRWFHLRIAPLSKDMAGFAMVCLEEITACRKAEQDLRESHALFHRVVEGTGDAIFIYDTEGRFLMHNSVCAEMFACNPADIVGKRIEEVFPPHLAQTIRNQNELVMGTGRTLGYELVLDTPTGGRTVLIQKGLYRNHRNQTVGIIGISRDITERKLAEKQMERSERHFRALIEKSNDCIAILSREGEILYVSPPGKKIFGFDIEQWGGTSVFFWVHPDDLRLAKEGFKEILELPGSSMPLEVRVLCQDGSWKWAEVTASNLLDDPGVQAVILNVHDISERKQSEQESRRFQAIIESSIDGILSVDLEGKITSWNPAAVRIFGYSEAEMLGSDFDALTPEDRLKESADFAHSALHGKAIKDVETVRVGRDGLRIEVSLTLSPIYDRDRRISGIAVIVRDITERRRLEREVLEIADLEKHRIGQDLHDDLCQHLVGISMLGNLLYSELAHYGLKQAEDARQITQMVRDAVDHARILARGLFPLSFAQGGLVAGLETLVANTEQLFRMPCSFECCEAVHIESTDAATHLYRIVQEALHNAVKHSQGTKVVVRMECHEGTLELSVRDDGIGPPDPAQLAEGGGLGMHTMYYRARIIGAVLSFARNEDGGATVTCRFPLPASR